MQHLKLSKLLVAITVQAGCQTNGAPLLQGEMVENHCLGILPTITNIDWRSPNSTIGKSPDSILAVTP